MFKKILIANRGEIACRVAATAARLGIRTVAIYSRVDAAARHVQACDEAVCVGEVSSASGGNAARDSYLRGEAIIEVARSLGVQAIHPGYGFLSENPAFATACKEAGLVFIGPPAAAIEAMGLKAQSKRLMESVGVPLVPGYHGADQSGQRLAQEAQQLGYPVLIKASAGGGGRGMRVVHEASEFDAALLACRREAASSFGNEAVLIEKYVQRPRHIEIQVFGDSHGNYVHLFERDCSVQRRHQKVLEEAPAPGMPQALRDAMGQAAVRAARAVGYVGAGTVEFIVEQLAYDRPESMQFYFMEMNTRLQVEHPVTEAIAGVDLVEWQLRVAAGEALPCAQEDLRIVGHAIEARLCAENPDQQFLPATGILHIYRTPRHSCFAPGEVRMDEAVREGDALSAFYDSMLGKLIVHGRTREEALAKMDKALGEVHVVGLATNVQFLRYVVRSDAFVHARLDTALIEREKEALFAQQPLDAQLAAQLAVHHLLQLERSQAAQNAAGWHDPFASVDGWRMGAALTRGFRFEVYGQPVVATHTYAPSDASLTGYATSAHPVACKIYSQPGPSGLQLHVYTPQGYAQLTYLPSVSLVQSSDSGSHGHGLEAPMAGRLIAYGVKVGQRVEKGQVLAVLEAMKMEHSITAPCCGEVVQLLFAAGAQVAQGAALLVVREGEKDVA